MKIVLKTICLLLFVSVVSTAVAQDKVISFTQLPTKAQEFVKHHFAADDVAVVTLDMEYFVRKEYEVILKNGTKMEFNADGEWRKVKMKKIPVPGELVPEKISQYIHKSFPHTFVKAIKKEKKGYEVEISNGLDLEFSRTGDFIRVDD